MMAAYFSADTSISSPPDRQYSGTSRSAGERPGRAGGIVLVVEKPPRRGGRRSGEMRDERGTGPGWYAEGRVRPDVGRKARTLERRRPPFWWLGDLPPQRISRRPQPAVCVPVQRLVRADHPAL